MVRHSKISLTLMCVMAVSIMAPRSQAKSSYDYYLDPHNEARKAVGVGLMVWDVTVAAYAQSYADKRKGDCKFQYSWGSYDESIFQSSSDYPPGNIVSAWVSEKMWYNYAFNSCANGKVCHHYTQVVWKKSTKLGCARIQCKSGGIFTMCNYSPPGNFVGQRPY